MVSLFFLLLALLQSLSKRHKAAEERNKETEHPGKESTGLQCVPDMDDTEENKVTLSEIEKINQ